MQIEATRLTSLVQELIDLSRVQNDDPLEDAEPVRVDELVAEAIDRCRHQAGAKQITMAAGRHRRPARLGQPRPARRRARQPRRERRQLLARPHPRRHRRPPGRPPGRGPHRDRRHRPGHRHLGQGQGAHLRALLPRRPGPLPCHRRHRSGSRDRQARGRLARRGGHGVERRRPGLHLHPAAAGGRCGPRPRTSAARPRRTRRSRADDEARRAIPRSSPESTAYETLPAPEVLP